MARRHHIRLELTIAARYLLAKKSHNAINAITVVAACGVAIITAALVCVLSVYNGFENLVGLLSSQLDPELKIVPIEGKSFHDSPHFRQILADEEDIEAVSATLQETVLIVNGGRQIPAQMKGVDSLYRRVTLIDSILWNGRYQLSDPVADYTLLGIGLSQAVSCRPGYLRPMSFYCPRREGKIDLMNPDSAFVEHQFFCSAQFAVQQASYDDVLCIVDLRAAQEMLQDSSLLSAYEVRMRRGSDIGQAQIRLEKKLQNVGLHVLDRREQQADSYRIVQIEKWVTFLLVLFILLIASFNIVGALSMLIIDKEPEISTLTSMGADDKMIRRIFVLEGWLISGTGAVVGIVLGASLCLLQEHFGIIGLGGSEIFFVVDSYPVNLLWSDVVWSAIAVLAIGPLATIIPTWHIKYKLLRK
ncbi:MAG: ABC transporter permease [Bacteroidales bacterium]|nr:ABC transporter permease [Bacteroidales bacterium]